MRTREEYLTVFAEMLIDEVHGPAGFDTNAESGMPLATQIRVSVGWPTTRALNKYGRTIGQCFHPQFSKGGWTEIFISPYLEDVTEVGATLAHELLHAALPFSYGHDHRFEKACHDIGLEGPATATVAGAALKQTIDNIAAQLGPYPHSAIDINMIPKATTRLLKAGCVNDDCPKASGKGFIFRVTWGQVKELTEGAPPAPTNMKPLPNAQTSYMFMYFHCPYCAENMALFLDTTKSQGGGGGGEGKASNPLDEDEAPTIDTGGGEGEGGGEAPAYDPNVVTPDGSEGEGEEDEDAEAAADAEEEDEDAEPSGGGEGGSTGKGKGAGGGNSRPKLGKKGQHPVDPDCGCENCVREMAAAFRAKTNDEALKEVYDDLDLEDGMSADDLPF